MTPHTLPYPPRPPAPPQDLEPFLVNRGVISTKGAGPKRGAQLNPKGGAQLNPKGGAKLNLARLEEALQDFRAQTGCSIGALKRELTPLALHLGTGECFHSRRALASSIRNGGKGQRVSKEAAKKHALVKNCLVVVGGW